MKNYLKMVPAALIAVSLAACSDSDDNVADIPADNPDTPGATVGK